MIDLRELQRHIIAPHLRPGGTAADYTMGNGHDTAYLSHAVGPQGRVWAFDVQPIALERTAKTLKDEGCPENHTLILASHADAAKYIGEPVDVGLFNLGYLPGGGNKALTTKLNSTIAAVETAVNLAANGGIVLVAVYPGHEEGKIEGETLQTNLAKLSRFAYSIALVKLLNSPAAPYFISIEKK